MFLKDEPDVRLGSQLKLKLNSRETDWQVVGIVAGTPPTPLLHANYPYLARVMGEVERAGVAIIVTHPRDPASQAAVARALEEHFKSVGMEVSYRLTSTEERTQIVAQFNVLIVFLMIMAVLLAVVGAIGLTGTMSLNVLERTRARSRASPGSCSRVFPARDSRAGNCRPRRASSTTCSPSDPDNPLLAQATREVLERELEATGLAAALARLRASRVVITDPPRPTPFAFPLMVEMFREKLTTEALEARVARMIGELEAAAAAG